MSSSLETIKETASRWVPRLEAGLTDAEEQEFASWIEADTRHAEVLAQQRAVWERFGSLATAAQGTAPDPDRYAPSQATRIPFFRFVTPALAAAAAVAIGFFFWSSRDIAPPPVPLVLPSPLVQQTLPDGSTVELNRGAEIAVAYSDEERRVSLLRGEANFTVAKNPEVPFIVSAGGVEVRAVGTAFNVRYDPKSVEVVVSEGRVAVGRRDIAPPRRSEIAAGSSETHGSGTAPPDLPSPISEFLLLDAGQRTVVSLAPAPSAPAVATLTKAELEARLAWQPKLLDFDDAPLAQIVEEFNERNPVRLVISDPSIASLRLNASFRSDNMEGFVRLLGENFNIRAESLSSSAIGLRRAR